MRRATNNLLDSADAERLMRAAIDESRSTQPHPNPRVGAVVTTPQGDVLATGAHQGVGQPHAEVVSLGDGAFSGCTMFVSLEPCNHHGRTPPCTEAVIKAGIDTVYVGQVDPDDRVSGSGIARLKDAGITVIAPLLGEEVEAADPGYFHQRRTGRPLVTLKMASTLDGQAAALDGTSQWITQEAARDDVHRLRSEQDAIIVGSGTVIADNPALTVRTAGYSGRQPLPVVVAGRRPIPEDARILTANPLVYESNTRVDLEALIDDLGDRGMVSVMVEGGPTLARSFVEGRLVDEIVWYLGASLGVGHGLGALSGEFATITDAVPITFDTVQRIGTDIKITAHFTED
jgi:diaminohydroxyphosphoribosylaminopyrimidine deaminase/5-amino-6-(5-phosphoribosylamino)uracil reductase